MLTFHWFTILGWSLVLLMVGIAGGIVGTTYYFRRWRKKVVLLIDTYKGRAREAERIIREGRKPGPIEKG